LVDGDSPSTKDAVAALAKVSERKNLLVVLGRDDRTTWLSLRNVAEVHLLVADQLNTYDVMCSDDVIFTETALAEFLAGPPTGRSAKAVATGNEDGAQVAGAEDEEAAQ
jgi:large subunit ribosomal protein L4